MASSPSATVISDVAPTARPTAKTHRKPPRPLKKTRLALDAAGLADFSHALASLCAAAPNVLDFISTVDACRLRLTDKAMRYSVKTHPWTDGETLVKHGLQLWRACFPAALSISLGNRACKGWRAPLAGLRTLKCLDGSLDLKLGDFEATGALAALENVELGDSSDASIAIAALRAGVSSCLRSFRAGGGLDGTLTDDDLKACHHLHTLHVCSVASLPFSVAGFSCLASLRHLHLCVTDPHPDTESCFDDAMLGALRDVEFIALGYIRVTATGLGLARLSSLRDLHVLDCTIDAGDDFFTHMTPAVVTVGIARSRGITWSMFRHFGNVRSLNIREARTATAAADWLPLARLESLDANFVGPGVLTDASLASLGQLRRLNLRGAECFLTDAGMMHLGQLTFLNFDGDVSDGVIEDAPGCIHLTEQSFSYMPRLETLVLSGRTRACFTGNPAVIFAPLSRLHTLHVLAHWDQPAICDAMLSALPSLRTLNMALCTGSALTVAAWPLMGRMARVDVAFCVDLPFSDDALLHLAGLNSLSLQGCFPDILESNVTTSGWACLAGIPRLSIIDNEVPPDALSALWARNPLGDLHAPTLRKAAAAVRLKSQAAKRKLAVVARKRARTIEKAKAKEDAVERRQVKRELLDLQRDAKNAEDHFRRRAAASAAALTGRLPEVVGPATVVTEVGLSAASDAAASRSL